MSYLTLAARYRSLGHWDEARAVCRNAATQHLDSAGCHKELYRIAFFEGDEAEMQRQVEWARGNIEEHLMRSFESSAAAMRGRFRSARAQALEGVDMAMRRRLTQAAADALARLAAREAYVDNAALTRERVAEALALDQSPEALIQAAQVLGMSGDASRASARSWTA
ncbi:MAG: hypothetical protein DMF80_22990 [Acidobacteria bacterium]|nr:MAG: hypothetical protein DMF80_22990 [Acidobacteriota bacterium]